ncbi:unnamed protein product [Rotaria sp. Silwood2]|nr:unnamed protein product [Rotaria sp. Silwood2]CAF3934778.1 unnamed protein product [Rotaria sp. Silwood2]CAF4183487.1 unnamed protein product [Rotaria sp. Silwood2]
MFLIKQLKILNMVIYTFTYLLSLHRYESTTTGTDRIRTTTGSDRDISATKGSGRDMNNITLRLWSS